LTGSVLAELALAGRIGLEADRLVVLDPTPVGTPEEDTALAQIVEDDSRDLQWWVMSLRRGLQERTAARLVTQGILTEQRRRTLWIFSAIVHPTVDRGPKHEISARLSRVLDGTSTEPRAVLLLSIAHAASLDRVLYPDIDDESIERRLIVEGRTGEFTEKLIDAIQRSSLLLTAAALSGT
jgi:hypothetical protein